MSDNMLDKISLHNVDMVEEVPSGFRLSRYHENVFKNMSAQGRLMARYSCNMEIRFVTDAKNVLVSFTPQYSGGNITVFLGDYQVLTKSLEKDKQETVMLSRPALFDDMEDEYFKNNLFSKNVWRIFFHGSLLVLNSIDAMGSEIRPPHTDELPKKTMLAYGSSITHGSNTAVLPYCYAQTFARLLRADILNKGVGGSCLLEKEVADAFSARDDWDFALLELGVNMRFEYTVEEFEKRCVYFIKKFADTGKKIILVTIFTNSAKYNKNKEMYALTNEFSDIIRRESEKYDNCILIEGEKILNKPEYLSTDGIHPSTEGHIFMGINMYNELKSKTDIDML